MGEKCPWWSMYTHNHYYKYTLSYGFLLILNSSYHLFFMSSLLLLYFSCKLNFPINRFMCMFMNSNNNYFYEFDPKFSLVSRLISMKITFLNTKGIVYIRNLSYFWMWLRCIRSYTSLTSRILKIVFIKICAFRHILHPHLTSLG